MFADELEAIERSERANPREERELIPIDSCSQLDTGYTGRSDCDEWHQAAIERERANRIAAKRRRA